MLALLAAWVADWVIRRRDSWFVCLLISEMIFIILFILVYIQKYYGIFIVRNNWVWAILITGLSTLAIFLGNFFSIEGKRQT